MALEFYVEQADRSPQSGIVNETIYPGELVHDDGSGVDVLTFGATGGTVGLARYDAQAFAREHEDDVRERKYVTGDEQRNRVQYQPFEDSAIVKVRTIEDDTAPAPNIGHRDVVGIVDETSTDAPANAAGRIVQEGYSTDIDGDTTTTTFNRTNSNFKAVGVAYRPGRRAGEAVTGYDAPVRVILFSELKEN